MPEQKYILYATLLLSQLQSSPSYVYIYTFLAMHQPCSRQRVLNQVYMSLPITSFEFRSLKSLLVSIVSTVQLSISIYIQHFRFYCMYIHTGRSILIINLPSILRLMMHTTKRHWPISIALHTPQHGVRSMRCAGAGKSINGMSPGNGIREITKYISISLSDDTAPSSTKHQLITFTTTLD